MPYQYMLQCQIKLDYLVVELRLRQNHKDLTNCRVAQPDLVVLYLGIANTPV